MNCPFDKKVAECILKIPVYGGKEHRFIVKISFMISVRQFADCNNSSFVYESTITIVI